MKVLDAMTRSARSVEVDGTIREAAVLMEQAGVGALAVLDGGRIAGVVTDRDIVRRAVARGVPGTARIDSVMTVPVVTVAADNDLHDAYAIFRSNAVRRLVVEQAGRFVGMITIDDLIVHIASDLSDLARPVTAESVFGHHETPTPAVIEV